MELRGNNLYKIKGGKMVKKIFMFLILAVCSISVSFAEEIEETVSEDEITEIENVQEETQDTSAPDEIEMADDMSAQAISDYDTTGSLFEKITSLEQEKIVMQLEKERAQLELELDRLNAEKMKVQLEIDTLSGRADQQQKELEVAKAELEAQAKKIEAQMEQLESAEDENSNVSAHVVAKPKTESSSIGQKYKLVNVVGVGSQLQATIEDLSSGQNKRISVGKQLDGYMVKSISLDDGIVFEAEDGTTETLNIGK